MFETGGSETTNQTFSITKIGSANKISITDYNQVQYTATVTGNSYQYDEYNYSESSPGYQYTIIKLGSGSMAEGQAIENGTFFMTINGTNYNGSWSRIMYKL